VTFLFTDIEGSTRLWESNPQAMAEALARHDGLLKSAIEARGGYVFKTVGDAFCAAFSSASAASRAALAAQRALLEEGWAEGVGAIRARMALHAGAAEERDGDYFGSSVNRVARLLSAGHGGQVLLSHAAQELTRDDLPEGVSLRDLGERRLKDLFRPERVFQLIAPNLPTSFPPLKTLDARINNLPAQPTPLIGRERELGEVRDLLRGEGVRLLTLTGPGGIGKTRLGLQVGAELLDEFEDGVFFVALAPITDPALVASAIAEPLGVVEAGEQPLEESLKGYLRGKELLLLLDNFEQVLGGASLVGELLSACPKLKVLATSRSVLRVYGEQEYPVPPLELPRPGRLPPIERLSQYEAVRLFIERAKAASPNFSVTDENAPAVAEICARLDGLPLAIELAAARIKLLTPGAMLDRLGSRLKLLGGGARDLPERQRTLRDTIEWSHALLEEGEQVLFARLAVFSGGRTLEAIETVCDAKGDLPVDALEGVSSLLDKSLLRQEVGPEGESRFVMLETIHEYARERLEASGEAEATRRLHAEHFLALAEEAEPELRGAHQLGWFEKLEAEHDNMRAALSWAMGEGDSEVGLRLAGSLWWFWLVRGHLSEGGRWLEGALAQDDGRSARSSARAKALVGAGRLMLEQGDLERATALLEGGAELFREVGPKEGLADALDNLGIAQAHRGELERARALFVESAEMFREAGDGWGVAESLNNLGLTASIRGENDQAMALHEESLRIRRELADKRGIAMSLGNLAVQALIRGDHERAATLCEEGLAMARALGDRGFTATFLGNLGGAMLGQGNLERATELLAESIAIGHELGDKPHLHTELLGMAHVAGAAGEALREARLLGAAQGLRECVGMGLLDLEAREDSEALLATARSQVEEEAWERAWEEGRAMNLDEAISYALEDARERT
jgi:predicted ATPase/class 3 adenylate cyclase